MDEEKISGQESGTHNLQPQGSKKMPDASGDNVQDSEPDEASRTAKSHEQAGGHDGGFLKPRTNVVVLDPSSSDDPNVDVVLIHGIWGHGQKLWRIESDPSVIWLRDAFGAEKSPRVVMLEYKTKYLLTLQGVYEIAKQLLSRLLEIRNKIKCLILANSDKAKYADVLQSVRVLTFFGYPHRDPIKTDLEAQYSRLVRLQPETEDREHGSRLAKALAKMTTEINEKFLHTGILMQTIQLNAYSTKVDSSDYVFDRFSATLGIDGELRVGINATHQLLTQASTSTVTPFQGVVDADWFRGDCPSDALDTLACVRDQAPPIIPPRNYHVLIKGAESLKTVLSAEPSTWNHIHHIRCKEGLVDSISEQWRNLIDREKGVYRLLHYFRFNSHDNRSNSLLPMLCSVFAHTGFNRIATLPWQNSIGVIGSRYHWSVVDLAASWEYTKSASPGLQKAVYIFAGFDECQEDEAFWLLRTLEKKRRVFEEQLKIVLLTTAGSPQDSRICEALSNMPSDAVTTIDYSNEDLDVVDADLEVSNLLQDDPRYSDSSITRRIQSFISSCGDDNELSGLLVAVLRLSENHKRLIESLTSDSSTPVSDQIFQLALGEIAGEHRHWAKTILSWMSASVRPLRVHEFHHLYQMCVHESGSDAGRPFEDQHHPRIRYEVVKAIANFHGLFRVQNDEIHFSHRRLRSWLMFQRVGQERSESDHPWYCQKPDDSNHKNILETCLTYLGRLPELDEFSASFNYIIEHWTHHYKLAGGASSERVVEQVLNDNKILDRWITLYKALPTPPLKPLSGPPGAFDIAAHFGLDDIITLLTTSGKYRRDAWMRAILEAVRVAELPTIQLLFRSMPYQFEFNDSAFQEIVQKSIERGDPKIAMEALSLIPKVSEPISDGESLRAKSEIIVSSRETKGTNNDSTPQDEFREVGATAAGAGDSKQSQVTNDEKETEKDQSSTIEWLGLALCQASKLDLREAVTVLLALGADPNTVTRTSHGNRSSLSEACTRGHEEVVRILLDSGADMELRVQTGPENKFFTPLYLTCACGNVEVMRLLLERGASVTAEHDGSWVPLHAASSGGAYSCADALLKHRKFDEYLSADAPAPLPLAVRNLCYKTAEALLRHGLDPNSHDNVGTALWHAVQMEGVDLCRLLLDYKADPNAYTENSAPPLVLATRLGNIKIVRMLVDKGADIEKPGTLGPFHGTPLLMAVVWFAPSKPQTMEVFRYLLDKKADPNVLDKGGWSALWLAAWWKKTALVRMLCEAGAEVNLFCTQRTPVHAAVESADADVEVVRALLDHDGDVNKFHEGQGTPLSTAVRASNLETIKLMLTHEKAKPDLTHPSFRNAVLDATSSKREAIHEILMLLLEAGADVDMRDESERTLLMRAMASSIAAVRTILQYRPNLQARDVNGNTVLTCLTAATPVEVVNLIIRCGGSLDVENKFRQSPLIKTVKVQNMEVLKFLLTKDSERAKINMSGVNGPPLHRACDNNDLAAANLLIEHKADIDYILEGSSCVTGTALMRAILYQREECARMLIDRGANVQHPSGFYQYPIITATLAFTNVDFVKLLLRQPGVSIDVTDILKRKPAHLACLNGLELFNILQVPDEDIATKDDFGRYPLHFACLSGDSTLVQEILERSKRVGVDINAQDDDGWTPLMGAARACDTWVHMDGTLNHFEIIKLLLDKGADPARDAEGFEVESAAENKRLTAADIARYHKADPAIVSLLDSKLPSERRKLQEVGEPGEDDGDRGSLYCDSCEARCYGVFFTCMECRPGLDLCFKCARHRVKIHPAHEMVQRGTTSTPEPPAGEGASEENIPTEEDGAVAGNDGMSYNFDDEIQDLAAAMDTASSGHDSSLGDREE